MNAQAEDKQTRRPMRKALLRKVVPLLIVLAAAGGVALLVKAMPANTRKPPPKQSPPVNVQVQVVKAEPNVPDTFDLPGVVEADRVVKVAAEEAGRVESYGRRLRDVEWQGRAYKKGQAMDEGQPIAEKDPILHLNRDVLQAEYNRAEAQYKYDLDEWERIDGLIKKGIATEKERNEALMRKSISAAAFDLIKARMERTVVYAPIGGLLNRLPVKEGEYVVPGTPVAEIVDMDIAKVVVNLPERDVQFFRKGQTAEMFIDALDGKAVTGEITYISELADGQTRSTRVEISVKNGQRLLRCGQIVRVRLTRQVLRDVIVVPLLAVIPQEEYKAVYVVEDGKAEERKVKLGPIKGTGVIVREGLRPGDRLIVSGHQFVSAGQKVNVVDGGLPIPGGGQAETAPAGGSAGVPGDRSPAQGAPP